MARLEGTNPKGGQISEQKILPDGEALTRAITESDFEHASDADAEAYTLHSTYSATGGQEVISLKNPSEVKKLHVVNIVISTSASGVVTLFRVTSGTAAGTIITPVNLNLGKTVRAVTAFGNASVTGSLAGDVIDAQDIGTSLPYTFDLGGALILNQTNEIAITLTTTGVVYVTIQYHFED